jgi:hypothetical protein
LSGFASKRERLNSLPFSKMRFSINFASSLSQNNFIRRKNFKKGKKMKKLTLFFVLFISGTNSWPAVKSPNDISGSEWAQLQAEINPALLMIRDTTVGTTICEETTGKNYFKLPADQKEKAVVVSCIQVNTVNPDTKVGLDILFPEGAKIKGVYITTRLVGPITAN